MKRSLWLLPCVVSLGCPFFGGQSQTTPVAAPVPTPTPSATASVSSSDHPPTSRPASRPAEAAGPALLVDVSPGTAQVQSGITVTLERFAIQPRTAEALGKEPLPLTDFAAEEGHFLSMRIAIERDGTAFFDMEGEDGELSLGSFALVQGVGVQVFQPGFVEPLPDRPDVVYQWRFVEAPVASQGPLSLRVLLSSDSGQDWEFQFDLLE
jgi:hypothetical protein